MAPPNFEIEMNFDTYHPPITVDSNHFEENKQPNSLDVP